MSINGQCQRKVLEAKGQKYDQRPNKYHKAYLNSDLLVENTNMGNY